MRFLLIFVASMAVIVLTISGIQPGSSGDVDVWSWLSRIMIVLIIVVVALGFRKRQGGRSVSD